METNFFNQFTPEQMKAQYKRNLTGLIKMRDKAIKLSKNVNGYSLQQLNDMVKKYTELSK